MDYKLLLDTAVMAGEILLESGAETWRVEDTMLRMLRMSGLKTADVLALTTGFDTIASSRMLWIKAPVIAI